MSRSFVALICLLIVSTLSGATCVPRPPAGPLPPTAFQTPPTLEELAQTLNAHTGKVYQLQTQEARMSTDGLPATLRADISLERPRKFRLRARAFGPPEIDLGSNDEVLWFWANRDPENAVYFANHQQSAPDSQSPLPLQPEWLVEAFGLVELSPQDIHQGPYAHGPDLVEVQTQLRGRSGQLLRSLIIDVRTGLVVQQQVADSTGRMLANLRATNHSFYADAGVSLPHRIEIELPPVGVGIQIDVGQYLVNRIADDPATIWNMPRFDGRRQIELSSLTRSPTPLSGPAGYDRGQRAAFRPSVRGMNEQR